MLIRLISPLCASLLVAGCASSKTFDAEGKEALVLNCSGMARNWGMCYEKAGELCRTKGYEVVEKSGYSGWVLGGSTSRTLVIRCKQ
jgi:hypothetical protein